MSYKIKDKRLRFLACYPVTVNRNYVNRGEKKKCIFSLCTGKGKRTLQLNACNNRNHGILFTVGKLTIYYLMREK